MAWISTERKQYADLKYPDKVKLDSLMAESGIEWWMVFITNYLKRSEIFSLATPQGRQALGKMITTAMDCLESACRVYGPMPKGGVTSGELS